MNVKKEIKESYLSIRINEETKTAFKKVADKRGKKISEILITFIDEQITLEGISKITIDENQMRIPME